MYDDCVDRTVTAVTVGGRQEDVTMRGSLSYLRYGDIDDKDDIGVFSEGKSCSKS